MRRIGKWLLIGFGALIVLGVIAKLTSPSNLVATATGTASPTSTASSSSTPEGTGTPTVAPTPTVVPTPTPVPTPVPTPAPAFADIKLSGRGDSVPRFEIPDGQAAIAEIAHTGSSNFAVITISADGSEQDLLVNAIGNYAGTVLFDEQNGQHSVGFEITADGRWTITVRPVTAARAADSISAAKGHGDDVIRIDPPVSGLTTFKVSHKGYSNFAIIGYSESGQDLLVNEIGAYSGEVLLSSGTFLLEISADGDWSVTPS